MDEATRVFGSPEPSNVGSPGGGREKLHAPSTSSVQSLDRLGRRRNTGDDSAEILLKFFFFFFSMGGHHEQLRHDQGRLFCDAVHPAFPLPTCGVGHPSEVP